jgi:hypothetical protein
MMGFEAPAELGGEASGRCVSWPHPTFHLNNQCSFFCNLIFTLHEVLNRENSNNKILTELFQAAVSKYSHALVCVYLNVLTQIPKEMIEHLWV